MNNILELNDDCLAEIFSCLPLRDLPNVFRTCPRFKKILPICRPESVKLRDWVQISQTDMDLIFRYVGKSIKTIEVSEELDWQRFQSDIELVNAYCTGLKSIKITLLYIDNELIRKDLISIFKRVKCIDFSFASYMRLRPLRLESLFRDPLPKLKHLSMHPLFAFDLSWVIAKNLEVAHLSYTQFQNMATFCKNCSNLKKLTLFVDKCKVIELKQATANVEHLESLYLTNLHGHCLDITFLNGFPNLKKLSLSGSFNCDKLWEWDQLTHLQLMFMEVTVGTLKKVANMKQLVHLAIQAGELSIEHLHALCDNSCEVLHLLLKPFSKSKTTVEYLCALLQLIESSNNLKELVLNFNGDRILKKFCEALKIDKPHLKIIYNPDRRAIRSVFD